MLFGDKNTSEQPIDELWSRAIELLRDGIQTLKELFERLYEVFKEACRVCAPLRPRSYHNAVCGIMRTIFLFKLHPAATMRFHVAATGD